MIWQNIKKYILKYTGFIYVPEEIVKRNEPIILHLSDTPKAIYPNLKRLIDKIQPEYIVHTGDLVDNLKIELYPRKKPQYMKDVQMMLALISMAKIQGYVTFGNHDIPESGHGFPMVRTIEDGEVINIEGINIMMGHYYCHLGDREVNFKMFGHQPEENLEFHELNGIDAIHVIFVNSSKLLRLDYPLGTDDIRTGTTRIGI